GRLRWEVFVGGQRQANVGKSRRNRGKAKLERQKYPPERSTERRRAHEMVQEARQKQERSKLGAEQRGEALRIRMDRFAEGLERTTDLLMSEALHAKSQLEHYRAILQYNQARSLLKFLNTSMIEP